MIFSQNCAKTRNCEAGKSHWERGAFKNNICRFSLYISSSKLFRDVSDKKLLHLNPMISEDAWIEYVDLVTNFHETFTPWAELGKSLIHSARLEAISVRMIEKVAAFHTMSQMTVRGVLVDVISTGQGVDIDQELVKPFELDDLGFMLHTHPAYMACKGSKNKLSEVGRRDHLNRMKFILPGTMREVTDLYPDDGFVANSIFFPPMEASLDVIEFIDPENEPRYYLVDIANPQNPVFSEHALSDVLEMVQHKLFEDDFLFPVLDWQSPIDDTSNLISGTIAIHEFSGEYILNRIPINRVKYVYDSNLADIADPTFAIDAFSDAIDHIDKTFAENIETDAITFS